MTEIQAITATPDQLRRLQHLLTRSADAHAWFEEMADKAEPDFRFVALKFRGLHREQTDRLTAMMTALGGEPDNSGGIASTVNRTSVSLRALFDEIDGDMLDGICRTEAHLLEDLEASAAELPASRYRDDLLQMRSELVELLSHECKTDLPDGTA